MTISLHRPDVANSFYADSLSARAFVNMAPSVSAACAWASAWQVKSLQQHPSVKREGLRQHFNLPCVICADLNAHVPQKNGLSDSRTCLPEDAASGALGWRRSLLHSAASHTRRSVTSQCVELGVTPFAVPLCHLQRQTKPLQDQCSGGMVNSGHVGQPARAAPAFLPGWERKGALRAAVRPDNMVFL